MLKERHFANVIFDGESERNYLNGNLRKEKEKEERKKARFATLQRVASNRAGVMLKSHVP